MTDVPGAFTDTQSLSLLQGAAAGAAVATLVNAALWAGGRVADVSFSVSPAPGDAATQVGVVSVVLAWDLTRSGRPISKPRSLTARQGELP